MGAGPESATLSWVAPTTNADGTPLTDLAGFKLYYREASSTSWSPINVGNQTNFTVTGLYNRTYHFTVTAYNSFGFESEFSDEIIESF